MLQDPDYLLPIQSEGVAARLQRAISSSGLLREAGEESLLLEAMANFIQRGFFRRAHRASHTRKRHNLGS
jgi:hypothetical protein